MSNGGNGPGGGAAGGDFGGASCAGTEYTLQGVMRFLQTVWHNHERARNSWDIERAEMKARIAKHEGEKRKTIELVKQLERHNRMLRVALKNEREKNSGTAPSSGPGKGPKSENAANEAWDRPGIKDETNITDLLPAPLNAQRNAKREALKKVVDEIAYLIAPAENSILPNSQPPFGDQPPFNIDDPYQLHGQNVMRQRGHNQLPPDQSAPQPLGDRIQGDPNRHNENIHHSSGHMPPHGFDSSMYQAGNEVSQKAYESRSRDSHKSDRILDPSTNGWNWDSSPSEAEKGERGQDMRNMSQSAVRTDPKADKRRKSALANRMLKSNFGFEFELAGHLDVIRSVIFTGGSTEMKPEICTAGDDGVIKRWLVPLSDSKPQAQSFMTHRGHEGPVTSLASASVSLVPYFSSDGNWIFSGGQDGTIRLWDRDCVHPIGTIQDHTDTVWALQVLPTSAGAIFGNTNSSIKDPEEALLLVSGSADGTVKIRAVGQPFSRPTSNPNEPEPDGEYELAMAVQLIHTIQQNDLPSPTCISPFSKTGQNFVVSYNDSSVLIINTFTGAVISSMASKETYDDTPATGVNAVVGIPSQKHDPRGPLYDKTRTVHGATGSNIDDGGVEGIIITGHEDNYIRIFDANSGQCTYTMLAHSAAISSLQLDTSRLESPEFASASHEGTIRIWDMEKRKLVQEINAHRVMRDEGTTAVAWGESPFERYIVSVGGDGFANFYFR